MRPYRGKTKDKDKRWVKGWYSYNSKRNLHMITEDNNGTWLVIPETVGQFTGLKDKNDKEIYEGDIIQHQNEEADRTPYAVPEMTPKNFGVIIGIGDSEWRIGENQYSNIEVIGNIRENPELIGESK